MKIFNIVVVLITVCFVLFGCSNKTKQEKIRDGEIVRNINSNTINIVEQAVIVGCPIPDYNCEFRGNNYEPTRQLLLCISLQKEIINNCRAYNKELEESKKEESKKK